jgi:N-acetylmuramoyl-L-alanine amidase
VSQVRRIVIHVTDSPDNVDIGIAEVRAWHTMPPPQGRGWSDVGYHRLVRRDGTVELGRYENGDSVLEGREIGAHVAGKNSDSYAIVWVGRDKMTPAQRTALLKTTLESMERFGLTFDDVYGHYELAAGKTCPNLDMNQFRHALRQLALAA